MSPDHAILRSVLSDQIKDRLLQAIMGGRYPPGSRIVETRVAREFGTSQAPVREALRDLEALGVVEIAAFRGARVRRPTAAELLEAYGVRTELESLGARLAVPYVTDTDVELLAGYVDDMHRAAEAGDRHAEAAADASFHAGIIDLGRNATLARVWRYLEPFSRTYISIVVPGADPRRIAALHVPILEALRQRDADGTVEALRRHFSELGDMVSRLWPDGRSASSGRAEPA